MEKTEEIVVEPTPNYMTVPLTDKSGKNSRHIPTMLFIETIEDYVDKYGAAQVIEELNIYYNKYKYMDAQIAKQNEAIKQKIPDIEKALDIVILLENKYNKDKEETINVDFMVSHNLWAKATVPSSDKICLWLGAEVLCEYSHEEGKILLNKNLENAKKTLKQNVMFILIKKTLLG